MDDVELDFSSVPDFEELDNELKCGICYERIVTPMITSCSHTFCSLCIRKWLATKQVCPACSETVYESSLRRNPMVENIITALYNFVKKREKRSTLQSATPGSSKIKETLQSQLKSKTKQKTSNLSNDHNQDSDSEDDFLPKKTPPITPRMTANEKLTISSRSSPSSNTPQRSVNQKMSIKSLSSPPLKTPQRIVMKPSTSSPAPSSPALSSAAMNSPGPAVQKGPKVACPVCRQLMPETIINAHLDKCLAGESTSGSSSNQSGPNTPSLSSNHNGLSKKAVQPASPSMSQSVSKTVKKSNERSGQSLEPIKKMVYNLFKDAQLKKELKKYGLSATGDRTVLLSRLNRYVAMHNAECDATNPRSLEELRKTFEKEDKSLIAPPSKSFSKLFSSKQPDPEEFEHHRKGYIQQNKSSFDTLVELARKTRQPKKESKSVSNGNVASTSTSISKVNFNRADSLSDSEEELSDNKKIKEKLLNRELSSSDEDTNASKTTKSELNKMENMTKKFIDPVVIDSSDSEIDYSPLGKDSPVKRHSDSDDSDNLSPEVSKTPLNFQKKAMNVKRKVQCVESASDEEAEKSGRPEKRASLEGRSPILVRKTPVRRELRSRASQSKKVIPSELPNRCRRSQRNAVKSNEEKPSQKPPSPDMFGTPSSSGSSDIPCGQAKQKQKDDAKDDDALSQLVSLIDDDDDDGSTTDFED
ncbi:E3 ubiquitin-protein ligase RAD18-like [Frankliniella occidentalis]|uniref:RING-type E3 ubiquitin transferase n=1 Tax=Frankliniella occidentalis TaxID=133901 RepID=A0A6J1TGM1_FRAOC|nr:E3 ubiquitin-protein ligase RAD18-like [Frankliniella occidentalis]XP_052121942.1 E3 ubiquitin-protein ligase RAD18-like [Frankliniella occidentalis]